MKEWDQTAEEISKLADFIQTPYKKSQPDQTERNLFFFCSIQSIFLLSIAVTSNMCLHNTDVHLNTNDNKVIRRCASGSYKITGLKSQTEK